MTEHYGRTRGNGGQGRADASRRPPTTELCRITTGFNLSVVGGVSAEWAWVYWPGRGSAYLTRYATLHGDRLKPVLLASGDGSLCALFIGGITTLGREQAWRLLLQVPEHPEAQAFSLT